MRLAIHSQALKDIFEGKCNPLTQNIILASKISITPEILNQYTILLGSDEFYKTWFASNSHAKRFSINFADQTPNLVKTADLSCDGYGAASYYGASNLVAENTHLTTTTISTLSEIGVELISIKNTIHTNIHGDNPFHTMGLKKSGTADFTIFDKYLHPEDSIVIYDKFINNESTELIEHIAKKLSAGSKLKIFHSSILGPNLLSSAAILARVQTANSSIVVSCEVCTKSFTSGTHDRYIFLGNRIQIVFTAGLDCFGKKIYLQECVQINNLKLFFTMLHKAKLLKFAL